LPFGARTNEASAEVHHQYSTWTTLIVVIVNDGTMLLINGIIGK
jgi:hypothetical protein